MPFTHSADSVGAIAIYAYEHRQAVDAIAIYLFEYRQSVGAIDPTVRCAVPKCSSMRGSLTASKTGVSFFSTPKDSLILSQWENNIGLMDSQHLTSKSKVCELHFAESDIIKGKTVKKDGRDSFILHKYWRLKASAVPVRLCGSSPTSDVDEHLSQQASEGTTSNSVIAVREPTCGFVQLGGTNIVNSTIKQNAGEK
ncbi:uncharacterized protein LOC116922572 [Daphnia magna]|nr:uncharacterized protein LOC116922572 [Daphnia magna]